MPSSLLQDYKSKKVCPKCKANRLITNDDEKATEKALIHYHCLNCNSQSFEYPGQKKDKDSQSKSSSGSDNGPSFTQGVVFLLMIFATILLINVIRQNERTEGFFWPIDRSASRAE